MKLVSCKSASLNPLAPRPPHPPPPPPPPPVVYSTDRCKAVVPVLVLLFVALWFILRGGLFYVLPCVILFFLFSVLLALRLPCFGKRELILVLCVRLFDFCLFGFVGFLLVSGKACGLWLWQSLDLSLTFFFHPTDRSKAGDPVLVLYFVALWFILRGDLFYVLPCVILFLCFFSPFSIAITSLGEERTNFSAFRTFVRFVLVWICRFPLGVWEGLRFVVMVLAGLVSFLYYFYHCMSLHVCPIFYFILDNRLVIYLGKNCVLAFWL